MVPAQVHSHPPTHTLAHHTHEHEDTRRHTNTLKDSTHEHKQTLTHCLSDTHTHIRTQSHIHTYRHTHTYTHIHTQLYNHTSIYTECPTQLHPPCLCFPPVHPPYLCFPPVHSACWPAPALLSGAYGEGRGGSEWDSMAHFPVVRTCVMTAACAVLCV